MPQDISYPFHDWKTELTSGSTYPATFGAGGNAGVADATNASKRYPTWMQVVGAGTVVVVNEDGSTATLVCTGGEVFPGTIKSVTSSSVTRLRVGTGDPPPPSPAALESALYVDATSTQAQINVPLASGILAAGTPLAAFADNASSNPGITLADSKAVGVRWNNNGTQVAVWYGVALPQDLDDTADIVLHALVSKTGATVGDAVTLTFAAFFQTVAALHDADTDCGGASSALTGDATAKTVTELTRTIAAADVPAAPCALSLSIKPTNGTLGTDDAIVSGLWIEYKRKLRTS